MTKVLISGAAGRMGQRIAFMVNQHPGLTLAGGFEQPDNPAVGKDMGEIAGFGTTGVKIAPSLEEIIDQGDVLIDFTFHTATMGFAKTCAAAGKAMVVGTTGLSQANLDELRAMSTDMAIVQSANMAVGVNVMFKIAKKIASILGNDYDMEIVEAHHNQKKDAPSGTALRLGEMLAEGVDRNLSEVGVFERNGIIGERSKTEIGIQTIRGGDIVGEHTIYYCGPGERIELTHRAHSRDNFARGAAEAASWLAGKKDGMFTMFDVLGLGDI